MKILVGYSCYSYEFDIAAWNEGWLERLVQPLVTWSWAATMPVRWGESSFRPSLSAANGQLLGIDADAVMREVEAFMGPRF